MGSIVSGILGSNSTRKAATGAQATADRYAKDVYFKPYTMTSGYGQSTYNPETGATTTSLADPYAGMEQLGLASGTQSYLGAGNLMQQLGGFDVGQRAADIYGEQAALLQPSFQQQGAQLQEQLVGSGRLGLKLAGGTVGAGGGLVQPDAFGLNRAQQQTLAEVAAGARGQALGEMGQMADTATGLMSAGAGQATTYAGLQDALTRLGIDAETARSIAASQAGNIGSGVAGQVANMRADAGQQRASTVGGLVSAGLSLFSDVRLKTNIKSEGVLPNGIKLYSWEWNDKYYDLIEKLGESVAKPFGVIAQEVRKVMPKAVIETEDGYLKVDYSMVMGDK